MRILSVSEMQSLESKADEAGHRYDEMMARAGRGIADAVIQHRDVKEARILVLVGPGNNGGDGLVAARHLQAAGARVTAYLSRPRDAGDDPVYAAALDHEVSVVQADDDETQKALRRLAADADVIVDALLGTGATPPLRGTIAAILEAVQAVLAARRAERPALTAVQAPALPPAGPWVVAVDGPSGLDFDTGEIDDRALAADLTVTFALPKWGQVLLPGAGSVGDLVVADIGIPAGVDVDAGPRLATPAMIRAWLPPRPIDAHKGTFGKAMLVAGSANYTGAAVLAATGAVRAGAGLVTLALPSELHTAVVPAIPEVTYLLLPHTLGVLNAHAVDVLKEELAGYTALLVGPGLSKTPETRAFVGNLFHARERKRSTGFIKSGDEGAPVSAAPELPPLVIDADGLNILSEMDNWHSHLPSGAILTPHPGEMARLTGLSTKEIQGDRLATARSWAETWQQVVVLKGAFTVIAGPGREPVVLPFANPGLSSAGTGDVLAGAVVALRAQGLDAFEAAVAGAYLHGLAGEIATARWGQAGTAARDVAAALAAAWRRLVA